MVPIGSSSRISIRAASFCARSAGTKRAVSDPATLAEAAPRNERLSSDAKAEHRRRVIAAVGAQHRGREVRMVRRVGEMLRLEAERGSLLIDAAALAGQRPVEEVAGIELHAGLGRGDVERASA